MNVIADLQLHSRFSRAVSPAMTIPNIAMWAARKGIGLVATGDWTHPLWMREIRESLEEVGNGLLQLKRSPPYVANENLAPSSEKLISKSSDPRSPKSEDGQNFVGSPSGLRAFSLYWGLRREEDIFWKEELEELAVKYPNFKFVLTLSQPSESWAGRSGRVGEHVFANEQNLLDCDFYLCGNKAMVTEMEAKLLAKSVPKGQIKKELFY